MILVILDDVDVLWTQILCNNCFKLQNQTYLCIPKFCRNSETCSSGHVSDVWLYSFYQFWLVAKDLNSC